MVTVELSSFLKSFVESNSFSHERLRMTKVKSTGGDINCPVLPQVIIHAVADEDLLEPSKLSLAVPVRGGCRRTMIRGDGEEVLVEVC